MLLQRLREYADRLDDLPPPMYQRVPIRYIIRLDRAGQCHSIVPVGEERTRGLPMLVPDCKRTVAIKSKLLADNAAYVLGVAREESKPERVWQQHAAFVGLVRDCAAATGEPDVQAVAQFLETLDLDALHVLSPTGFEPSANFTFEVTHDGEDVRPVDLPAVRAYWAKVAATGDETALMECLVCGEMRPPVERLPISIKGIPGGQSSGLALISANARAFESYGLEASLIAPTCEDCGQRFGNALNALLRQEDTRLYVAPLVYIFWAREPAPFSLATLLQRPENDDVQHFLTSAWRSSPEGARLASAPFYAAALSASGARVVVRDWIETTLDEARDHLTRYFGLQRLRDAYTGEFRWFALPRLARATINSKSKREEPAPQVIEALLHVALRGGALPEWLLYQAIRRMRAEQGVTAERAALVKMVIMSQRNGGDALVETHDLAELDTSNRNAAYLCGRLLAELEAIQREALGDISATVVDRYYGTASSAPASVFPRLLRGAQPHLSKLRRTREGTYRAIDERLQEIMRDLPAFPTTLTLRNQGLFALGYYHQKAENTRARNEFRARKALVGVAVGNSETSV